MTTMKERLRAFPDTEWSIKTINIKADVPSICLLIENWTSITPDEAESVRVNASGQVRAKPVESNRPTRPVEPTEPVADEDMDDVKVDETKTPAKTTTKKAKADAE